MRYLYIGLLVIASLPSLVKGQIITTVAGNGTAGYSGDGGQATNAEIRPGGVATDAVGNLYIVNNIDSASSTAGVIRKVNTLGIISTIAGVSTWGYSGDGAPATAAKLNNPTGVAFDAVGNLYIADQYNNRIRIVNTLGIINTFAGNGSTTANGDGGAATAAGLGYPEGIAIDANGNLYFSDRVNNRIRKISTSGIINTIAGNGVAGYSGDGGQATAATLYRPLDLAIDEEGNLYINDNLNDRIRKVNTLGIITTIVGNGINSYSGDGGQATAATLNFPGGVVVDAASNIYIGDMFNMRIRRMINTSGIINTIVGNGTAGYSGDGGQATGAELNYPQEIALDAVGNLYIADAGNARIRKVTNAAASGIEQFASINEQVTVYPNPASTSLTLTLSKGEGTTTLQIIDMLGNMVKQLIIDNSSLIIDVSGLSEGVYNILIHNSSFSTTKKVVIVR